MQIGRDAAIDYIETKERKFLQFITNYNSKPQLIAAGPFLVIRDGWDKFVKKRNPIVIHLDKNPEGIYQGLLQRRQRQKEKLDISNPNFGSWDNDVTTELKNGKYQDISEVTAIENVKGHLGRINPIYHRYRHFCFDSDSLKNNDKEQQKLIELILLKLRQNQS
jgi:hypothetical protein